MFVLDGFEYLSKIFPLRILQLNPGKSTESPKKMKSSFCLISMSTYMLKAKALFHLKDGIHLE